MVVTVQYFLVESATQEIQGRRSGASLRLPLLWPGFDSRTGPAVTCGLSLLLVLVSAIRGFSPDPPVFLPEKPTLQIPIRSGNEGHRFVSYYPSVTLTK